MTEDEYVVVSELTKLRAAATILRGCLNIGDILKSIYKQIDTLEAEADRAMEGE